MTGANQIRLDLPAGSLELAREDALRLRDAAAAEAGRSTRARDLSLLLDRALGSARPVALRRGELHTLVDVARSAGLDTLAADLADHGGGTGDT